MAKNLSQFVLRTPPELLKRLDEACQLTKSQRTGVVNRLIERFVEQTPQERFGILSGTYAPSVEPLRLTPATERELANLRSENARLQIENTQLRAARDELLGKATKRGARLTTHHNYNADLTSRGTGARKAGPNPDDK